jgi:transmembrane 9 superfamily member 2/4
MCRILDNLPVAMVRWRQVPTSRDNPEEDVKYYDRGFPVGYHMHSEVRTISPCILCFPSTAAKQQVMYQQPGIIAFQEDAAQEAKVHLHNHLRFTILVNLNKANQLARIVGFEVEPFSVKHRYDGEWPATGPLPPLLTCNPQRMEFVRHDAEPQVVQADEEIIFTYDIMFTVRTSLLLLCLLAGTFALDSLSIVVHLVRHTTFLRRLEQALDRCKAPGIPPFTSQRFCHRCIHILC